MTIELTWVNVLMAVFGVAYIAGIVVFRGLGLKALIWPIMWAVMALFGSM